MANSTITLTAALRSNLLSLQGTQSLLDATQFRLATGKKVNSALDNPNSYFTAAALTNRANDLAALVDGEGQAIQTLTAADQGITSLTKLVQQAQSIAKSAQDSISTSSWVRSGDISAALQASVGALGSTLNLTSSSGATATITVANQSLATIASSINAVSGFSANIVDGSATNGLTTDKRLEIRAVGNYTLTVTANAASIFFAAKNSGATSTAGTQDDGTAWAAGGGVAALAATSNTADQITLQKQFDAIRTQIDQLISDTGYRGVNLLNGDTLTTQFNEKNTSKQVVTGVTFNSAGLGITAAVNEAAAGSAGFLNAAAISTKLDQITTALSSLRTQAQSFGNNLSVIQTRQDFTNNLVNILKAGSDKLTLADKNEEGANLLSLQTSQQLGIQALALASQANQSVLRLFQ